MDAILVTGQSNARNSGAHLQVQLPYMQIVNTAVGGSSIIDWQKDDDPLKENLYDAAIRAVAASKAAGHNFIGWWHMQGERETANQTRAQNYRSLTVSFFRKFALHAGLSSVPLVFGQLGEQPTDMPRPYWSNVQNSQAGIARDFPEWRMIITKYIKPYEPVIGPHWAFDGYSEMARRVIVEITSQR